MLFVPERRRSRGYQARSAPAMFAPPICRRSRQNKMRTELTRRESFVGFDEDGGSPANIAASASEPLDRASEANGASGAIKLRTRSWDSAADR